MTLNSIPILLVLHKDVNRLAQQLIGSIVYVVKVQMGKQYAVYVVDNIFRLHRQVVERVAQLLMVRERKRSKRPFLAEHWVLMIVALILAHVGSSRAKKAADDKSKFKQAAIFFTLSAVETVTKKDFGFMANFLFVGMIIVLLAGIANIFFAIPALALAISAVALVIFSAYILVDVSRIVNGGETNYITATLQLYLDVYNVFVSLLNILMMLSGNDRD